MDTAINERAVIGSNSKLTRDELEAAFKQRTRDQRIAENTPFDLRWQWEVWLSDLTPNGKLVAFAVRIFASSTGSDSRPSIESLVQLTGLSRQTVVTQLKAIQKELLLTAERGKGRASSTYTLIVPERTIAEIATVIDIRSGLPVRPIEDRSSLPTRPQSDPVAVQPLDHNDRSSLIPDRSSLPVRPDITRDITTVVDRAAAIAAAVIASGVAAAPLAAAPTEPPAIVRPASEISGKELIDRLQDAGGRALNLTKPIFHIAEVPRNWLAAGADLERDILPTIRAMSTNKPANSIHAWKYFESSILGARDARLAPLSEGRAPPGRFKSYAEQEGERIQKFIDACNKASENANG